jgi:phosphohistidine phosphatase SixA
MSSSTKALRNEGNGIKFHLLLLRHSEAEPYKNEHTDSDRSLLPRGIERVGALQSKIEELGNVPKPLVCLSSGYVRAEQTLELLDAWKGIDHLVKPSLRPETTIEFIFSTLHEALQNLGNHQVGEFCVALVGHNPSLSYLRAELLQSDIHGIMDVCELNWLSGCWDQRSGLFYGFQLCQKI